METESLSNFQKISDKSKKKIKILFDREIDMFLSIKEYQISSDYQFVSSIEKRIKPFDEFKEFLNKELERSFDSAQLYDKFFFNIGKDFLEDQFDDFLLIFFQNVCPNNLSNLTKDIFLKKLEEYQQNFQSNDLIKRKAKYIWKCIGFNQNEYCDKLIPENFEKFDIEKILVLHNICVLFSYKLNFVYVPNKKKDLPHLFTVGCIYTENLITVALHYDSVGDDKKFHLFLLKPQSVIKKPLFSGMEEKEFTSEINEIYNMNLFHCNLLKENTQIKSESLCEQILNNSIIYRGHGLAGTEYLMNPYFYETSFLDFPIPIFQEKNEKARLFTIYHPKQIKIIDMCFNDTSVYVISKCESNGYIQIFEGNIGTQCLDDMYVCAEIALDQSNYDVFGKITISKNVNVATPTAFIIFQKDKECTMYVYKRPQTKTLPYDYSNNIYYPCKSDYYVQWAMVYTDRNSDKKIAKTFKFKKKKTIKKLDYDERGIIFEVVEDNETKMFKLNLDYLNEDDIESRMEPINQDQTNPVQDPDQDPKNFVSLFKISPKIDILGIEINNQLFLLLDKNKNIYFHPAKNNFHLKLAIKSAFCQYKQKVPLHFDMKKNFGSIEAIIDVGYHNSEQDKDFNNLLDLNPLIPGIYYLNSKSKKKDLKKLQLIFANADMLVGKDIHRTKCQLIVAYALSKKFIVYGPNDRKTIFKPKGEVYDNWTSETVQDIFSNLIATYGVLLQTRDDNEFNFALKTLKTTKNIIKDFDLFYEEFQKCIWNIF